MIIKYSSRFIADYCEDERKKLKSALKGSSAGAEPKSFYYVLDLAIQVLYNQ
jgi:hypothetical protein